MNDTVPPDNDRPTHDEAAINTAQPPAPEAESAAAPEAENAAVPEATDATVPEAEDPAAPEATDAAPPSSKVPVLDPPFPESKTAPTPPLPEANSAPTPPVPEATAPPAPETTDAAPPVSRETTRVPIGQRLADATPTPPSGIAQASRTPAAPTVAHTPPAKQPTLLPQLPAPTKPRRRIPLAITFTAPVAAAALVGGIVLLLGPMIGEPDTDGTTTAPPTAAAPSVSKIVDALTGPLRGTITPAPPEPEPPAEPPPEAEPPQEADDDDNVALPEVPAQVPTPRATTVPPSSPTPVPSPSVGDVGRTAAPPEPIRSTVTITEVDTGSDWFAGMLFPVVMGEANPGSKVHIRNGDAGEIVVKADKRGNWKVGPLDGFGTGPDRIDARADTEWAIVSAPFSLSTLRLTVTPANIGFFVRVDGPPGAKVDVLIDGVRTWGAVKLEDYGAWGDYFANPGFGYHEISARILNGKRTGPAVSTQARWE